MLRRVCSYLLGSLIRMQMYCLLLWCCILAPPAWGLTEEEMAQFRSRDHVEQNTGVQGYVSVAYDSSNEDRIMLQSNGVPDHDTGIFPNTDNPNSIQEKSYSWKIAANPEISSGSSCLPMGPIGMAVNGVPLFNSYTRTCCDAGQEELDLFDICTGHPAPGGAYHYHIYPSCVKDIVCGEPSSIIGVAFDGFPIYGPHDENGTQLTKGDLDRCNGRIDSNGNYKYHIIKEFPYIMGCYNGTVVDENIRTDCQCTSPVYPCTDLGRSGRRKRDIFKSNMGRQKRATTELFQCCTNETTCSELRKFNPGDGNGFSPVHLNFLAMMTYVASALNGLGCFDNRQAI